jgi:hypothetical protein
MPIPVSNSPDRTPNPVQSPGPATETSCQSAVRNLHSELAIRLLGEGGVLKMRKVGDFRIVEPTHQHGGFLVHKTGEGEFEPHSLENVKPDDIEDLQKRLNNSLFKKYHFENPIEVGASQTHAVPLGFSYLLHATNTDYKVLPESLQRELMLNGGKILPMHEEFENDSTEGFYMPTFVHTEVALLEKILGQSNPDSEIYNSMQHIKTNLEKFSARNIQFKMLELNLNTEQVSKVASAMYRQIQQETHFAIPVLFLPGKKEKGSAHVTALAFTKNLNGTYRIEMMNRGMGVSKYHEESPYSTPEKPKFNTVIAYHNVTLQKDGPEGTFNLATLTHLLALANSATPQAELETMASRMAEFYNTLGQLQQQPQEGDIYPAPVYQAPQKSGNCGYSIVRAYTRTLERNAKLFDGIDYLKQAVLQHHARQFVQDVKPLAQVDAKVNANLKVVEQHVLPQLEQKVRQAKQRVTSTQ